MYVVLPSNEKNIAHEKSFKIILQRYNTVFPTFFSLSFSFSLQFVIMEPMSNIPCSALTDALTALAQNTSPGGRKYNAVKTIPRAQHTSYLTDTADAVREVAKKMGKCTT